MLEGLHPNNPTHVARIVTDEARARRIADLLGESFDPAETAVAAFEREDGTPKPPWLVEVYFRTEPNRPAVTDLIRLAAGTDVDVAYDAFGEKDWVAASLEGLAPVVAGRFTIHGSHDRARVKRNSIGIEIEAALAFGTGHHGTTRGCLLALDDLLKRRRPRRPLDIGTGTGVLAIAAARALHRRVLASDIDPQAIATARNNIRFNRAGAYVAAIVARGTTAQRMQREKPYDLVFANILLGPLARLAAPMGKLLAPGATVILSGLLHAHANAALAAYRAQGLSLVKRYRLDEWTTLVLQRGGGKPRRSPRPAAR
ncbi:50S ribosomal protein L11 methyltransferase [Labrys wisconsinensis]|uniref:Ribosomal protein L11 methyltransferase n=1 Tax=Labrys wisconsinensis TaxID=425677 RepID=A0ABU0JBF4_9HYPH|nr:50S ribosomal protein L11 methyltransferase [Labrys wisconsinensis]MDQ0471612.1 ribosomal protein L11 methyltransferase [Labrys wisconsinensis]